MKATPVFFDQLLLELEESRPTIVPTAQPDPDCSNQIQDLIRENAQLKVEIGLLHAHIKQLEEQLHVDETLSPNPLNTHSHDVVNQKSAEVQPNSKLFRTDKTDIEACIRQFNEIITTAPEKGGKQKVLRALRSAANSIYFNCDTFIHEDLATELNKLQKKFIFTKDDIDTAYKPKQVKRKKA